MKLLSTLFIPLLLTTVYLLLAPLISAQSSPQITGELRKWHKITFTFNGPQASETGNPNPFLDYRFTMVFTSPSGTTYTVPGHFAADGNAANTSATSGNKWRAHFAPDETGTWNYQAIFRQGSNVAVASSNTAGSATSFNGTSGTFNVSASNKSAPDNRARGRLNYVGIHHLQWAQTGEYFLKGGADAPENFLAYEDFDNTPNNGGRRKNWSPHAGDWNSSDPSWQNNKGTEIIGAINYLAGKGMNAFSFLTMNIGGDDKNVFPYISDGSGDRTKMDVSKLDQWAIVLDHANAKGMYLHFKTQETENETLLDGGNVGTQRKLYYRELISRFGHNLALNWNLGEENGALGNNNQTTAQRKAMAQYFFDNDPYHHNIVIHNPRWPDDLLGNASELTGQSIQTSWNSVHAKTLEWINKSASAGVSWIVANDEQGGANCGVPPDNHSYGSNGCNVDQNGIRKETLWGNFMAGGAGVEYYFGYGLAHSDLTAQDYRSRDQMWNYTRYALEFFNNHLPFWEMTNNNGLTSTSSDFVLQKPGEVYAIYLKNGGTTNINLPSGNYTVRWYNPRSGGGLQTGSVSSLNGSGSIGNPPSNSSSDWAVLIQKSGTTNPTSPPGPPAGGCPSDINNDGITDLSDYSILVIQFFQTGNNLSADINGDNIVDLSDYSLIVANFLKPCDNQPPPSNPTPTPNTNPTSNAITSFTLINADSDTDIRQLSTTDAISLSSLPTQNLNIRANTTSNVTSVTFSGPFSRTEGVAPFALFGDNSGDYINGTFPTGTHTITATPSSGSPLTLTLTVNP